MVSHYREAGSSRDGRWAVDIDASSAGWEFSGIRVLLLGADEGEVFDTGDCEYILVPFEGSFEVVVDGVASTLFGRHSVFEGPTDVLYVPRDSRVEVHSTDGGRLAMPNARARRRHPVQYLASGQVPVALRGAGSMTRMIRDFGGVDTIVADRLIACEVITPGGNWSSYPAHKHDEESETESQLEEIYYFEVAEGPSGHGVAYQRAAASDDRSIDVLEEVRSGDVVLIPHGWHGPAMASPGFDLYYLNVMAGPAEQRSWRITDEPSTAWIRDTWADLAPDTRLL